MSQNLNELFEEYISEHMGDYIIESIERMIEWSDMSPIQQLCVIDGAIAFGAWQCCPRQMRELREIRSAFIEDNDSD